MVGSPRRTNTKDNNLEPNSNYYILDHISTVLAFCTPCSAPEPESSYLPESLRRHPTSPQTPTNRPELRILSWLFSSRIKRCISAMPWHVLQQCDAWPNSPVLKEIWDLGALISQDVQFWQFWAFHGSKSSNWTSWKNELGFDSSLVCGLAPPSVSMCFLSCWVAYLESKDWGTARELVKNPKVWGPGPLKFLFVSAGEFPP